MTTKAIVSILEKNGWNQHRRVRHGILYKSPAGMMFLVPMGHASEDPRAGKNNKAKLKRVLRS